MNSDQIALLARCRNDNKIRYQKILSFLKDLNGYDLSFLMKTSFTDEDSSKNLHQDSEVNVLKKLIKRMLNTYSPEYSGFFLFNITKALDNELFLSQEIRNVIGSLPFKQFIAFKTNHNFNLQFSRLILNSGACIEVASLPEVIESCGMGFSTPNIIYANPTINEREFVISYQLGVTAFCFDRIKKLKMMINWCQQHDIDFKNIRLILRLATPFAGASMGMERFGLEVIRNKSMIEGIIKLLRSHDTNLAGVSFHIGIGAKNFAVYDNVFSSINSLFEKIISSSQRLPKIINIGGGFPMSNAEHLYLGALPLNEQISYIGRHIKELQNKFDFDFEIWSEIGQGITGNSGSIVVRVDFFETRENPRRSLSVAPYLSPGSILWGHTSKEIFSEQEQHLITQAGAWSLGINKYITFFPEVWSVLPNGEAHLVEENFEDLIPTLIYGKTCEPNDILNPKIKDDWIRVLMPNLCKIPGEFFVLRLCAGAYIDNGGDFNWNTFKDYPVHHIIDPLEESETSYPRNILSKNIPLNEKRTWEYRDRILRRNALTSRQIHEARCLVADQFFSREPLTTWLRKEGKISSEDEIAVKHLFWEKVDESLDSGLSMVRLKVPINEPDRAGKVVCVMATKILHSEADIPKIPLPYYGDYERRIFRTIFETEVRVLQRVLRINGQLKEKIFPMAYTSFFAKKIEYDIKGLLEKILLLANGTDGIKSWTTLTTGKRSTNLASSLPGSFRLILIPYEDISYCGEAIFSGIVVDGQPGIILNAVDLRGPYRFKEPLPKNIQLKIDIGDGLHIL
uniref:Diaminopimelate decarboxylase n=1 Tax=Candidatus Kentrum sp. UNK TaxID=2126344 RepID=A0A451B241_9GAMM|nr:MAG: Diaminopimelate decarboxylase [Candidatus Kentron sp. UNK]VFK72344.1 MAG: Diaminopimelate decarboxylase [Candidatus Kentron sp. UNK]